ncbi:MAG: carbohydrate ABC transporter permease [Candidatus Binataceae bacterium]
MSTAPRGKAGAPGFVLVSRVAELIVGLAAVVPLYLLGKQALSPELESFAWPPIWLPRHLTVEHFRSVFAVTELRSAVLRSVFVAGASAAIATVLGAMLAYSMARSRLGRRVAMGAVTAVRLLPMIAVAIPLALGLIVIGLYDSASGLGLAVVHAALALPTTALTTYSSFLAVPVELEEAAWLDGASALRVFAAVDLPLARTGLAAAFVLSFILSWDEFGYALLIQVTNRTLPPLLYYYTVFGDVGAASALALLMMVPAVCVVIALRPMLRGALMAGSLR